MSFICTVQSTLTCNSFPKIFGGSQSQTYLFHIDVYNDYLALVGRTNENSLTGIADVPYLALTSISQNGYYYWAKALSLKIGTQLDGVQFSTDGALLIAHSYSYIASNSYIVVFNVFDGNILSARSYSAGGIFNFSNIIRSMIVSSGASPMAYVLSRYQTGNGICTGQHLFKFDPLIFSFAAVWIKQTLGSNANNCGNLGLTFGRTEHLLYAFSQYNGASTVSLLDFNGISQWQYSTPDGYNWQSNIIKYKQQDPTTDIVIATSGYSYINYNRIIHSSSFPYSVVSTETFRDPTANTGRRLYALYIIDQDNAVSLIYEYGGGAYITDLATIKFQTPSVQYQRAFPKIGNLQSAIFTSATVYYVGQWDVTFYTGKTPSSYYLGAQSIVYSSDMTSTSCYLMQPIKASSLISMAILTTMAYLPSSIYGASTVTFVDDTQAYTTVDIDKSKIKSISSWCPQSLFTVKTVTQSKSTFSVTPGVSDQNLAITPFSATLNCGSYSTAWTYTGVDNSDGHELVKSSDLLSVDSATGSIFVSQFKPIGIYIIKVIGTLPDLVTTTSAIFTIQVNTVPMFSSALDNVIAPLMKSTIYPFPSITDPDFGATTSVSVVKNSATGALPSFITYTSTTLIINPTLMTQVKAYTMIVIITDSIDTNEYRFQLAVAIPPLTCTDPVITQVTEQRVSITWDNIDVTQNGGDAVIYYQLEWDQGKNDWIALNSYNINMAVPLSYIHSPTPILTSGMTIKYRLRAKNGVDYSPYSSEISVLCKVPRKMDKPMVSMIRYNHIDLYWNFLTTNLDQGSDPVVYYHIEFFDRYCYSPGSFVPCATTFNTADGIWTDLMSTVTWITKDMIHSATTIFQEGKYFNYRVRAKNGMGWGDYSDILDVLTPIKPQFMYKPTCDYIKPQAIKISWVQFTNSSTDFNLYQGRDQIIYYTLEVDTGTGTFVPLNPSGSIEATFTHISPSAPFKQNTIFKYRVAASNGMGIGAYSDELAITTLIVDLCKKIVIQTQKIPSMQIIQSVSQNTPLIMTKFKLWSDSTNGLCGTIHYTLSQVDGLPIPSFVEFQRQSLFFIIYQRENIKSGTYQFKLVGEIKNQWQFNNVSFFNITIKNKEKEVSIREQVQQQPSNKNENYNKPIIEIKHQTDQKVTGKIVSINETGGVAIKFSKPIMKVQNYSSINEKVLSISVKKPGQDNRNVSIENWKIKMMSLNIIKIQLNFNEYKDVSAGDLMDTLHIKILDNQFFQTKSENGSMMVIQNYLIMTKFIPRQINPRHIIIMTISSYMTKSMAGIALACGSLSFISSTSLTQLMGLINVSQILLSMPLMNISFPPNAQLVFQYLHQLITFDIGIDTDNVPGYNNILEFNENQEAISIQFERQGYESYNMIQNMGMSFVQLVFIVFWQLVVMVVNFLHTYFGSKANWIKRKEKQAFFNTSIIILLEGALEFFLLIFINLLKYDFKSSRTEIFSTSFAIFIMAITVFMIICNFSITSKIIQEKELPSYNERVAIIFEGLSQQNFWKINYHTFTVLRKIYLAGLLVFLKQWPLLQIFAFYIQSIAFLLYVVICKPMKDRKHQNMEVGNEIAILMSAFTLPALTSYVDTEGQYLCGWFMTGILILTVGSNTLYNLVLQLIEAKEIIKRLIICIKQKCKQCKKVKKREQKQVKMKNCEDKTKIYAFEQQQIQKTEQNSLNANNSYSQFELEVQDKPSNFNKYKIKES